MGLLRSPEEGGNVKNRQCGFALNAHSEDAGLGIRGDVIANPIVASYVLSTFAFKVPDTLAILRCRVLGSHGSVRVEALGPGAE